MIRYSKICLLQWSFTGKSYYFRQAGYKLNYSEDGKVEVSRMTATILVYLKSDEGDNSFGNILTIHLRVESETKDVVLVRASSLLPPQGETAKHSVESEMQAHTLFHTRHQVYPCVHLVTMFRI